MGVANESAVGAHMEDHDIPPGVKITIEVISILVMIWGIPGNLLTLITVIHCKRLHTSGTVLIALLSLADALYYITVLPFRLALLAGAWPTGPQRWPCAVSAATAHWVFGVSMSCMSCIAFNRYTHVLKPGLYKVLFSRSGLIFQFGTMWLLVGVLTVVFPLSGAWGDYIYHHDILSCTFDTEKDKSFKYFVLGIGLVVPCAFIIICYSLIYYNVRTSQKRLQSWTKTKSSNKVISKVKVQPASKPTDTAITQGKPVVSPVSTDKVLKDIPHAVDNPAFQTRNRTSSTPSEIEKQDLDNTPISTKPDTKKAKQNAKMVPLSQQEKQRRASLRMTAMMVLTFGVFLAFMAPYILLGVIDPQHENPIAYLIAVSLTWCNGCFNPVIYVAMNGQFRRATKEMLQCKRQRGLQSNGQDFSLGTV